MTKYIYKTTKAIKSIIFIVLFPSWIKKFYKPNLYRKTLILFTENKKRKKFYAYKILLIIIIIINTKQEQKINIFI